MKTSFVKTMKLIFIIFNMTIIVTMPTIINCKHKKHRRARQSEQAPQQDLQSLVSKIDQEIKGDNDLVEIMKNISQIKDGSEKDSKKKKVEELIIKKVDAFAENIPASELDNLKQKYIKWANGLMNTKNPKTFKEKLKGGLGTVVKYGGEGLVLHQLYTMGRDSLKSKKDKKEDSSDKEKSEKNKKRKASEKEKSEKSAAEKRNLEVEEMELETNIETTGSSIETEGEEGELLEEIPEI
jgi:hypothetical protein